MGNNLCIIFSCITQSYLKTASLKEFEFKLNEGRGIHWIAVQRNSAFTKSFIKSAQQTNRQEHIFLLELPLSESIYESGQKAVFFCPNALTVTKFNLIVKC